MVLKLKERFGQGISVDVQDLFSRYTMDTATEFLFGQDVKSLSGALPYPSTYKGCTPPRDHPSDRFATAFNRAEEYSFPRGFFGKAWRIFEFWQDKVVTQREIMNEVIDPLIREAMRKKGDRKKVNGVDEDDGTLLDYLVTQTEGTKKRYPTIWYRA